MSEPACKHCYMSQFWEDCWNCGGEGYFELYDEDPIYYDEDDTETCETCRGKGGYYLCFNEQCPAKVSDVVKSEASG